MASVPFDVLFDPLDLMLPAAEIDSDDAVEIGATSSVVSTTLSLTEFRNGELIFSNEVPVCLYMEWRDFKSRADKDCNDHNHQWLRVELKANSKRKIIESGYSLVATRSPRGNAWTYQTKFKPGWKGREAEKPQPGLDVKTFSELLKWLETAPFEYWETRSGCLTAGISRPECERLEASRDARKNSFTLMGVCADFDKYKAFLENSEKVRMLRSKTQQGTIRFSYVDPAKTGLGKSPKLYKNLVEEALCYLDISIMQALAGDKDSSRWSGRPVVDLIDEIYREHLNNANRRERRRMGGGVPLVAFDDDAYSDRDQEDDAGDEIDDDED